MLRETLALTAVQSAVLFLALWGIFRLVPSIPANAKAWLWRLAFLKPLLSLLPFAVVSLPLLPAEKPAPMELVPVYVEEPALVAVPAAPPSSKPDYLLWAWGVGVVAVSIYGAVGMRRALRTTKGAMEVEDGDLLQAFEELLTTAKIRRRPRLLSSDAVSSAMLIGGRKSAIVLPKNAPLSDLRLMMAHEVAHIARYDLFWFGLASAVQSLFFFNPMVWVAARCSRLDHESATDRYASHLAGVPIQTYADMLLRATVIARPSLAPGSLPVAESYRTIHRRLEAMKHFNSKPTFWRRTATAALAILTLSMLPAYQLSAAAWQDHSSAPKTAQSKKTVETMTVYTYEKGKLVKAALVPTGKSIKTVKNKKGVYVLKDVPKGGNFVIIARKTKKGMKNEVYELKPVQGGVPPRIVSVPGQAVPGMAPLPVASRPGVPAGMSPSLPGAPIAAPAPPVALPGEARPGAVAPTPIAPPTGAPAALAPIPTTAPATGAPGMPPVQGTPPAGAPITVPQKGSYVITSEDGKVTTIRLMPTTNVEAKPLSTRPVVYSAAGKAYVSYAPLKTLNTQGYTTLKSGKTNLIYSNGTNQIVKNADGKVIYEYKVVPGRGLKYTDRSSKTVNGTFYVSPGRFSVNGVHYKVLPGKNAPEYITTKDGVYKLIKPNKGDQKIEPTKNERKSSDQGVGDPKPPIG